MKLKKILFVLAIFMFLISTTSTVEAIELISNGLEGWYFSNNTRSISSDGRFIILDKNYVLDRQTGSLIWGWYGGGRMSISSDGRYVGFVEEGGGCDPYQHAGIFDTVTKRSITLSQGSVTPTISYDGNFLGFVSGYPFESNDRNNYADIYLYNRITGGTQRVSLSNSGAEANGGSSVGDLNQDSTIVAFQSSANNLVSNDTNNVDDIFVRNVVYATTVRASISSDGLEANAASNSPSISADGRYVAFTSTASNLVTGDTNEKSDVFVRDLLTGVTNRISVSSDGSQANGESYSSIISGDGRYVVYQSLASNLFEGDSNGKHDIFVYDMLTKKTKRISQSESGAQGSQHSYAPSISYDGKYIVFSTAAKLVSTDTDTDYDVYLYTQDSVAPTTTPIIEGNGKNGWYRSDVTVTLSAQDNTGGSGVAETVYSVDGGVNWVKYSTPFVVGGEGQKELRFKSKDRDDNIETAKIVEIKIDKTAPTISFTFAQDSNGTNINGAVLPIKITATDSLSNLEENNPAITWGPSNSNLSGQSSFKVYAEDKAGNIATRLINFSWLLS